MTTYLLQVLAEEDAALVAAEEEEAECLAALERHQRRMARLRQFLRALEADSEPKQAGEL